MRLSQNPSRKTAVGSSGEASNKGPPAAIKAATIATAVGLLVPGSASGEDDFTPAPESRSSHSAALHANPGLPVAGEAARADVQEWPAQRRKALADTYVKWISDNGMLEPHISWHQVNGFGGTRGPGSGEAFLQFHAQMMEDFRKVAVKEGILGNDEPLPTWNPETDLPKEFHFHGMASASATAVPPYLSLERVPSGSGFVLELEDGTTREIHSLHDVESPDELGRLWGESNAHADLHGFLGGAMTGYEAVRLPPFLLIHGGILESVRATWSRETANGRQWLEAHPSGWTEGHAHVTQHVEGHHE